MSYTSSTYLLFLVAVFCIYYIIRPRHRMYVLLVANVIFYLAAGFDQFLVLLQIEDHICDKQHIHTVRP